MDYYGLFPKFKFNRPLNEAEKYYQLNKNPETDMNDQSVVPDVKVISMNSHYLEMVDKYYSSKGFGSLIAFFGFASMLLVIALEVFFLI